MAALLNPNQAAELSQQLDGGITNLVKRAHVLELGLKIVDGVLANRRASPGLAGEALDFWDQFAEFTGRMAFQPGLQERVVEAAESEPGPGVAIVEVLKGSARAWAVDDERQLSETWLDHKLRAARQGYESGQEPTIATGRIIGFSLADNVTVSLGREIPKPGSVDITHVLGKQDGAPRHRLMPVRLEVIDLPRQPHPSHSGWAG